MDALQIQEAWQRYKVYGDMGAREQLIKQYTHLVKLTVARIVPYPPPGMEWEDLYSHGTIGLIKAVDQFDPTRNVKFETYAIALIRGAVLEALRSEDWVPRSARDKLRQLERAWVYLEAQLGRPPTDEETAQALGISVQEYRQLLLDYARTNMVSLEACVVNGDEEESVGFYNFGYRLKILLTKQFPHLLAKHRDQTLNHTLARHITVILNQRNCVLRYARTQIQLHLSHPSRLTQLAQSLRLLQNKLPHHDPIIPHPFALCQVPPRQNSRMADKLGYNGYQRGR
jgi:RNA polymerase sigma factor (sigma-70 family)